MRGMFKNWIDNPGDTGTSQGQADAREHKRPKYNLKLGEFRIAL